MKSGNLNFLKPSGPLQACNGTDLRLTCMSISSLVCRRIYTCIYSRLPEDEQSGEKNVEDIKKLEKILYKF